MANPPKAPVTPSSSPIISAPPASVTAFKPRRSKRQESATFGTRRSLRAVMKKHAGNDFKIYGDDYGILPSDWSHIAASAIPGRVPLGFVCGYPVGAGGELYGGSMFLPSAASDTLQGKAIQKVNEQWGSIPSKSRRTGGWEGYQSIGIPVCKKKYKPFEFRVERRRKDGSVEITVERMFGCHAHSNIRKGVIMRHVERKGWVSNFCICSLISCFDFFLMQSLSNGQQRHVERNHLGNGVYPRPKPQPNVKQPVWMRN